MSQSVKKEIINSYSFIAFAIEHGPHCVIQQYKNKVTGDLFKSVDLTNKKGEVTHVNFSSLMGELTGAELVKQKYDLQVLQFPNTKDVDPDTGEVKVKQHFCLCKKGQTLPGEVVDLGL